MTNDILPSASLDQHYIERSRAENWQLFTRKIYISAKSFSKGAVISQ